MQRNDLSEKEISIITKTNIITLLVIAGAIIINLIIVNFTSFKLMPFPASIVIIMGKVLVIKSIYYFVMQISVKYQQLFSVISSLVFTILAYLYVIYLCINDVVIVDGAMNNNIVIMIGVALLFSSIFLDNYNGYRMFNKNIVKK